MNKKYVLSLSYGKDSMASIEAINKLGWQLDEIVTADVWFDDNISANLPDVEDFKKYADAEIKKRYGITVTHKCAMLGDKKYTYLRGFYNIPKGGNNIWGFPLSIGGGGWCHVMKNGALRKGNKNTVSYIGIAADEDVRIARHINKENVKLPLVEIGWCEKDCYNWCKDNNLLSPTYSFSMRDGCWFCHNQSLSQLRYLYHNYKELWNKLLEIDKDSVTTFHADGHTVHDLDIRFKCEDLGIIPMNKKFRWKMLDKFMKN